MDPPYDAWFPMKVFLSICIVEFGPLYIAPADFFPILFWNVLLKDIKYDFSTVNIPPPIPSSESIATLP